MVTYVVTNPESDGTVSYRYTVQGNHEGSFDVWVLGCSLVVDEAGSHVDFDRVVGIFGKQAAWLALTEDQRQEYVEELVQEVTSMMMEGE